MTGYRTAEQTFAAADSKIELAQQLFARAEPLGEGEPRLAVPHEGQAVAGRRGARRARRAPRGRAADRGPRRGGLRRHVAAARRDRRGRGLPAHLPRRPRRAERQGAEAAELFPTVRWRARRAVPRRRRRGRPGFVTEGHLEKAIALASLGIGPVYGAGGRGILGSAPPPESELVLVIDRTPDDKVVDLQTKLRLRMPTTAT